MSVASEAAAKLAEENAKRKTFTVSRTTIIAAAGSANSPNLPFGEWEFVKESDGDTVPQLFTKEKGAKKDDKGKYKEITCYKVRPVGNPDGVQRRVYPMAVAVDSARNVLFNEAGAMFTSATFGIYQTPNGSEVSSDPTEVSEGIMEAQRAYAASKALAEAAAMPAAAKVQL